MKKKIKPRIRFYNVVSDAVSTGACWAANRYSKYAKNPLLTEELNSLIEHIEHEVLLALDEVLDYD